MFRLVMLGMLAASAFAAPVAVAETLTVTSRAVSDEKAVFATVESISVVPARGRIGGVVVQLNVREGDSVTSGQAIAAIGDEKLALQMKALDAQIDALQAQSNQAQVDFTRIEGGAWHAASRQARRGQNRTQRCRELPCAETKASASSCLKACIPNTSLFARGLTPWARSSSRSAASRSAAV